MCCRFKAYALNAYTDEHADILTGVGHQVAIAIENAKLFTAAQQELAERQRMEAQLRESEERYRLISAVSSDYTFSTMLNAQGELHLNWVAGAFEKITGYSYEEYMARGGWLTALHPDDVEQDARDMEQLRPIAPWSPKCGRWLRAAQYAGCGSTVTQCGMKPRIDWWEFMERCRTSPNASRLKPSVSS